MLGTLLGVLALGVLGGTLVRCVRVFRGGHSRRRRAVALLVSLFVLIGAALPVDSIVGDVQQEFRPSRPELTLLAGAQDARTFVLFPTIILPAAQMYATQIPLLRQYGHVVLVDYARGDHKRDSLSGRVTAFLRERGLDSPYVVGTSFGVVAGMDFLRYYEEQGRPSGPVTGFMAISGPADGSDVKTPVPLTLSHALNGGPLTQWLYSTLYDTGTNLQYELRPLPVEQRGREASVPHSAVRRSYRDMKQYDVRSLLARLHTLSRTPTPPADAFPHIPTTILWVGHPAGDYLISDRAIIKLQQAFPDSTVVAELPGDHANLIRWGPTYTTVIEQLLDEQLLEPPVV